MQIKLSTLLWLLTLVAVFCVGLFAPSPFKPKRLEPILVTTSSFDNFHQISPDDVTVEMRPPELIPPNAATHINQIENGRLASHYPKGIPIGRDYVFFNISDKGFPLGCKFVGFRVSSAPLSGIHQPQTRDLVSLKLGDEVVFRSVEIATENPSRFNADEGRRVLDPRKPIRKRTKIRLQKFYFYDGQSIRLTTTNCVTSYTRRRDGA